MAELARPVFGPPVVGSQSESAGAMPGGTVTTTVAVYVWTVGVPAVPPAIGSSVTTAVSVVPFHAALVTMVPGVVLSTDADSMAIPAPKVSSSVSEYDAVAGARVRGGERVDHLELAATERCRAGRDLLVDDDAGSSSQASSMSVIPLLVTDAVLAKPEPASPGPTGQSELPNVTSAASTVASTTTV